MVSFAVLLLCAVSGHTLGSTLKPLQEMNMEDAVLSLSKQMEERFLLLGESVEEGKKELLVEIEDDKNEILSKLEQVLNKMSEIEKGSNTAIGDVSDKLQVEKNKLLLMNNHLLAEVLELRKRDLDTFEKIANVESEVRDRVTLVESVEQVKKIQEELLVDIKRVERNYLEDKNEQSTKLEQILHKISEIEKSSNVAIGDVSDRLQVEKNKLLLMNNNLSAEVLELQKRDIDTFGKIANVESELSRDRVRADLLQVRLNETANMTHSCLASQRQIQETVQKNIERLNVIEESNLSSRIGDVENLFKSLRPDLDYASNRQDDTLKLTVQNNTNDIGQLKQEISRVQTICSPPCENGGQCVKNVCNCTPFFTGDRCQQTVCSPPCENGGQCVENVCNCTTFFTGDTCQQVVCSPPCENGGQCMRNNICKCTSLFYGDRCQDGPKCGVDFDNGGSNGGGNVSSVLVWPWIAAVYRNAPRTGNLEPDCGGSVIHRYFVLTSASCVDYYGSAGLSVKLEIPQDELFYKPQSAAKAVYIRDYLSSPQTNSPEVLNFTLLSQEECRRKLKETNWDYLFPSPDLSFCGAESSPTPCMRLGSPLMQSRLTEDGARTWTQVGIYCESHDCEYPFSPRLDHLRAWVDATIVASSKK